MKLLLDHGSINVGAADKTGDSALIYAAALGQRETTEWLLNRSDIDINHTNKVGLSALILAASRGTMK
ncbi:ankyrin repeat domain-containing protein [Sodalis ligni]|uniref:ankyrin repeat domain-containing protein n=1 Tax=Sodalis ligni TaxID=2697027 RepID=UPI001BDE8E4D|nr:ankyrin repeat domain-containing protein [Sodalis ligni]